MAQLGIEGILSARRLAAPAPVTSMITASTVDDASSALSAAYAEVSVSLPSARHGVELDLKTFTATDFLLGQLELTTAAVRSVHFPWFAVCMADRGEVRMSTRGASTTVAGRAGTVVAPGDTVDVEYLAPHNRMRTVVIARGALETELSAMLGRTIVRPLTFDVAVEHAPESAFGRSLDLLVTEVMNDGLTSIPVMANRLTRMVMTGILTSYRHSYTAELEQPPGWTGSKPIRTAIDLIEDRPCDIVTVGDLAKAVGLSVRALDSGFRRYVGVPPMRYLRKVRLARVHTGLLAADPEATTATAVARDWGFLHYGRFAAEYQQVYGCTPAASLRSAAPA
jgi:AraC-like DNA-binding protein